MEREKTFILIYIEKKMQPFGITGPQYHIMKMLKREGPARATQLADMMNVKPSAITVIIDRLIERGLVERCHSDTDRRVVMMQLTKAGEELVETVSVSFSQLMGTFFSHFSNAELMTFYQLYKKLDQVIDEVLSEEK
ncbi:MarR family transcriptional regulator [Bacillus sp. FSL W8-0116]|uniref:MarR family winged helix-turn-helix transcriptional regulator n=1 Tax=Bacillus sp. FSL W8-0116 TaxID=2978206 RepID=UPI0030F87662